MLNDQRLLLVGFWLLVVGFWILVVGCCLCGVCHLLYVGCCSRVVVRYLFRVLLFGVYWLRAMFVWLWAARCLFLVVVCCLLVDARCSLVVVCCWLRGVRCVSRCVCWWLLCCRRRFPRACVTVLFEVSCLLCVFVCAVGVVCVVSCAVHGRLLFVV